MTTTVEPISTTLGTGEETITYDVRGDLGAGVPLLIAGSPMEAAPFATLASYFTDRPVVTYDPRGAGRNPTATGAVAVEQHVGDLHRVVTDLGVGPVDLFGSSGGAVNALRLAELHPEDVRTVVAHEPPTAVLLPDRDAVLAAMADVVAAYHEGGQGPGMARFIRLVMVDGELPADFLEQPAPDPAQFGMPTDDDGDRSMLLMRNVPATNLYDPDVEALRALGPRLHVAVGDESHEEMAARGGRSVAAAVGIAVTRFPSHHGGFMPAEGPFPGDPDAFAARLREVLDTSA
jgi:pimeloyl-ACP methyl ester carboxylesterase